MSKWEEKRFQFRKAWFEKHIKIESHTIEEVCQYIKDVCGFVELHQLSKEYQEEYAQMRLAFMAQYKPELLGEYAQVPKLTAKNQAGIKKMVEFYNLRQQAAENIPINDFDIDLHIYKKETDHMQMRFLVERKYGYISGGAGGDRKHKKQFEKMYRDVYKYYGVTKEDVEQKTSRYSDLVRLLAR